MAVLELFQEALLIGPDIQRDFALGPDLSASTPYTPVSRTPSSNADPLLGHLVNLDRPEWYRLLTANGYPSSLLFDFDDLVAKWLSQADYMRLLELARRPPMMNMAKEIDDLFDLWIDESHAVRLIALVNGLENFQPRILAGAYAISTALRAVKSVLEYSRKQFGFSDTEVRKMMSYLQDTPPADDHTLPNGW